MISLVLRCALCRRVRDDEDVECRQAQWSDVMTYMAKYHLEPSDIVLSDTQCDECTLFYRQLLTYGQVGQSYAGWTTHGPFTT